MYRIVFNLVNLVDVLIYGQDETRVYKNLLQEVSQRVGALLPTYTTFRSGLGHLPIFTCTVELASCTFAGEPAKNKKQAEKNAAMSAWSSLKLLCRKVRDSERYHWAATQGVNEEVLMENLPEDLQRDIRRHLFKFVKKASFKYYWTLTFSYLNNCRSGFLRRWIEPILDAICERLRQKTYIKEGTTLYEGGFVTKMVFIVRGKMESTGEDGNVVTLSEGDVCGEESSHDARTRGKPGYKLVCKRTVKCLSNMEASVLRVADLEEITTLFAGFLRNHHVQMAIRYLLKTVFVQDVN
ncbi:putative cyclic nucleotide-binding domain, rmlC-like jelly roll, double-stranded RNA-binding protein [Helianthus anomalus]